MKHVVLVAALFIATTSAAQSQFGGALFDYDGYAKYLYTSYETGLIGELLPNIPARVDEHLIHARLNTHWYFTPQLRGELDIRARAMYGGTVAHIPGYFESLRSRHAFGQLDWKMWEDSATLGYAQIDRLYLDYSVGDIQVTLGRQRIAWGTAFAWNIIDVFNPKDVLDFDYEELPGADALRVQYYTGAVTKLEAAYRPGKSWEESTLGGLWSMNQWDYDFHLVAGARNGLWFAGGAWAGDIADAGFRGEVSVSEAPGSRLDNIPTIQIVRPFMDRRDPMISAVVSGDYTFPNSLNITAEALYNNYGVTERAGLLAQSAQQAGLLSPARWSTYLAATYTFHPLVTGTAFAMYNPADKSVLAAPQVSWSALTNFDVMAIAFFTSGDPGTEFGGYGNFYFLRGKWSF